ncbi:MAG: glycerophosphodiester phosphodiesterase [Gemmatimonadales bacterium]|nr:glycerophosphodiester phosphodiesterase [Gemmatimonadales bacterium]NIN12295.1 glycerophosphodiester phosphodiesterase [Gemmatimonadales bacterium]NIN50756.1 glycerophosphodiester phosphodiesterase [Gemmatimonadales bacterium]NIP08220.1 glycerophosphodiester phosphodiesterase [Gemmatimonadales bacterium]NIQ99384.1 glycerophosphodiester phosphodiesterase [Gemmatimonadales bacterium]
MILLDPDARPLIGHRGASGECPENTLLAFDRALEQGADALELDVRATADGVPVVIHDPTVDRTTSGTGEVRAYTLDRLRSLDAGQGERVPTLAEVLERYPSTPIIVEIKDRAASAPVAQALTQREASGRVLLGSFDHAALRPFVPPAYARSASRRETTVFWVASRAHLAPAGSAYGAFTVPEHHRRLKVVDGAFVWAARRRGKPVHVWTVDDPADARRLRSLGVAGIITNFPARMRTS